MPEANPFSNVAELVREKAQKSVEAAAMQVSATNRLSMLLCELLEANAEYVTATLELLKSSDDAEVRRVLVHATQLREATEETVRVLRSAAETQINIIDSGARDYLDSLKELAQSDH